MNENLLYMILGVLATIIIGYFGIRYTLKQKIKTQLTFFENGCVSLFKSVVKDLDGIEIKYKGKVINENLILFKGTFFNSGNTDIDSNIIHKPLTIELPKNYYWAKSKIIDKSPNVIISESIDENKMTLVWDILKENEYITFDSVIEYKPTEKKDSDLDDSLITKELSKNIKFSQRITNLKSINKERIPSKPIGIIGILFISVYLLAFIGAGLNFSVGQFVFPKYEIQFKTKQDSLVQYIGLKAVGSNEIGLMNNKGKKINTISDLNLKTILQNDFKIVKKSTSYLLIIMGGILTITILFILIFLIKSLIEDSIMYKKIKIIIDKHSSTRFNPDYRSRRYRIFPFE